MGELIHTSIRFLSLAICLLGCSSALANNRHISWQHSVSETLAEFNQNNVSNEHASLLSKIGPWGSLELHEQRKIWLHMPYLSEKSQDKEQEIEQRRREFESLSPGEKNKIREKYKWFHSLSPEEQKEVRKKWKQDKNK